MPGRRSLPIRTALAGSKFAGCSVSGLLSRHTRMGVRMLIAGTRAWMISPQMNQDASCPTKTTAWQATGNMAADDSDECSWIGGQISSFRLRYC